MKSPNKAGRSEKTKKLYRPVDNYFFVPWPFPYQQHNLRLEHCFADAWPDP